MLNKDYITKVQRALDKHYSTGLDESGDHAVHIYQTDGSDNAIIVRHPTSFDGQDNDEMPAELKRFLVIRLIAKDGEWKCLVNQQLIHASKFAGKSYSLCLNQFKNNIVTEKGQKALRHDLAHSFHVKLSYNGLLIAKVTSKFITAYDNLVKAIKFIEANGANYTQQGGINPIYEAEKELRMEEDAEKDADEEYKESKAQSKTPKKDKQSQTKVKQASKPREHKLGTTKSSKPAKPSANKKNYDLSGKKVVALGRLSKTKSYYRKTLKSVDGSLQSHVNSRTDYVICNKPNKSKEYQKAIKLHLPIIKEDQISIKK